MSTVPRPEYPRPQLCRENWTNLNGEWRFAFDDEDRGRREGWQNTGGGSLRDGPPFDRTITVPITGVFVARPSARLREWPEDRERGGSLCTTSPR